MQAISNSLSPLLPAYSQNVLSARNARNDVDLKDDATWKSAAEKNISRQSLYNNIVKEVLNALTRIIGWALISFVSLSFC